jgi:hypothetical protein
VLRATSVLPPVPPYDRVVPYPPLRTPGLRLAYQGPDARVYRIEGALPRTWVVGAQQVVAGGDAALDAVTAPGFDPRRAAVTERRLDGLPERPPAGPAGAARIVSYDDERVVVHARAPRRALLVLGDVHLPGWKATVDGREAPVERVDYVLRGVQLGPGAHTVEFRYEPLSWRIGWITTVVALAGLAAAVVAGLRSRRGH